MTSYIRQSPFDNKFFKGKEKKKSMVSEWEQIQTKTFTKWVNNKLDCRKIKHVEHLFEDLSNGVKLIQLLEIISGKEITPYNKNPITIFQRMENVNTALDFVKSRGVPLTNIGAEDIVSYKNHRLVLGLLWLIILRFIIDDISQDGKGAKEGLLLWCQRKTLSYDDVDVRDFTQSWSDGLAFCALIHYHRPDLLDYHSLDKTDRHGNTALAFEIANREYNIPKLLDVEDVCDTKKIDDKSIMTYVAEYFHAFSACDGLETAGRRVANFADVLESVWDMTHQYEERVQDLMETVKLVQHEWENTELTDSYIDAKNKSHNFNVYKNTIKRKWVAEKRDVNTLLNNIQTKTKTYNLNQYYPPPGLTPNDLDDAWNELLTNEAKYHRKINRAIREIKEGLRIAFAQAANDFQKNIDTISANLVNLEGPLSQQLEQVEVLAGYFEPLHDSLEVIEELDAECIEANTEENDHTVYSLEDLKFSLDILKETVQKRCAFIQNQMIARNMTNLTPAQLEEFEQTFRYFDADNTNTLNLYEFCGALSSLGFMYDDEKAELKFYEITKNAEFATFEQFIRFMVQVTEDKTTPDQLLESFKTMAQDKPFITELDLTMCHMPQKLITSLKMAMPQSSENENGYDYGSFVKDMFIQKPRK